MKKDDIYEIRTLFQQINTDYKNDANGLLPPENPNCRASKIKDSITVGIEICDKYINKMKPLDMEIEKKNCYSCILNKSKSKKAYTQCMYIDSRSESSNKCKDWTGKIINQIK